MSKQQVKMEMSDDYTLTLKSCEGFEEDPALYEYGCSRAFCLEMPDYTIWIHLPTLMHGEEVVLVETVWVSGGFSTFVHKVEVGNEDIQSDYMCLGRDISNKINEMFDQLS